MFITTEIAKAHLRDPSADAADLALKSDAAELAAIGYLDRAVFANQAALDAAVAAVPAALIAASAAYAAADAAADLVVGRDLILIEKAYAFDKYMLATFTAARTRRGMVINPVIQSAMLLLLSDLWESREDTAVGVSVASVPNGARSLLDAYRHYGA